MPLVLKNTNVMVETVNSQRTILHVLELRPPAHLVFVVEQVISGVCYARYLKIETQLLLTQQLTWPPATSEQWPLLLLLGPRNVTYPSPPPPLSTFKDGMRGIECGQSGTTRSFAIWCRALPGQRHPPHGYLPAIANAPHFVF